ncbi:MAG: hypothetical protein CL843_17340 [Crocinitomicaceae bacterium]|nr:hypothetical protein [Crocinitomicaceae bacterium]|tara:strand:+ start:30820 stop:32127 length:1308 start_codon:yes stop_codon:yes gene_type:complete
MKIHLQSYLLRINLNKDKMKKVYLALATLIGSCSLAQAQFADDSVSIGAGYTNQSYYSLENGEIDNIDNTDWDLAFSTGGYGYTFRVNGGKGTTAWLYPNGDTSAWNTVDTSGITTWSKLTNSIAYWSVGALSKPADPNDAFDMGWGVYDLTTHHVTGDRIFILQTRGGNYKKLVVESLISGVYTLKMADLNGSNETTVDLTKANYADKNFGYYDIDNAQALDREPYSSDWDLVFTSYAEPIVGYGPYSVTGVLANAGIELMMLYPINDPFSDQDTLQGTFTDSIATIGREWKAYDFAIGGYVIADSTAYLIKTANGDVWQMVMTGFSSSEGKFVFSKKKLDLSTGVNDVAASAGFINAYPNPAKDNLTLAFDLNGTQTVNYALYDLSGKEITNRIQTVSGFSSIQFSVSEFPAGVYFIKVAGDDFNATQKIIIQ